ncbi:MAG: phosphoribosylformylglycinamidine cyclo-ligase [Thermoflavifilum sp.]|uniref:AIR synthase related protein n=1 Tax=Thermoflavifilum sp. TaxID=1968839 RepID=UPI0018A64F90|nr:AIR synthase-related protein [Thermoflavifilum sp.]QOR76252.1 MAG: phosphoribosylformylglycinamidine cyclo-ligase [Thermoflavifilum sp.]
MKDSLYHRRGVSASKEEVHAAIARLEQGLYPHAFCRIFPDYLAQDPAWACLSHADGAGTKSLLAYLYWRETGDINIWKGIAQDALVMNLDDLLCVGAYQHFVYTSTIGRNKKWIPAEVLKALVEGTMECIEQLRGYGVDIHYVGGETADVGDLVRTIIVDGNITVRWPQARLVTNEHIHEGDVIVGLASAGQTIYEQRYNSGIGSNGLTLARHELLHKSYLQEYPEACDAQLDTEWQYTGPYRLTDRASPHPHTVGELLLSPTRTYAPLLKALLEAHLDWVHGLVHCTGGGQTKLMRFLPPGLAAVKDQLFPLPPVFQIIRETSQASWEELFQVFNMGHRMEIITAEAHVENIVQLARDFGIEARVVGRIVKATGKATLHIMHPDAGTLVYPSSENAN